MKKQQDIIFTEYRDTEKWKIVNDFTIHEDRALSDRSFMLTKVPKRLWLELKDTQVIDAYNWSSASRDEGTTVNDDGDIVKNKVKNKEIEDDERKYTHQPYIVATASVKDKITIFGIDEGALLQFDEIGHVRISPIPSGNIGGKSNASIMQSLAFSGMASRNVPVKGLMEGEPGQLWLNTESVPNSGENEETMLQLDLYLDEPQFDDLFATLLANSEKITKLIMNTVIELFETEVQASLNEPWMASEYGLLKRRDKDWVSGRARIDGISVAYSKPTPVLSASKPIPALSADVQVNEDESETRIGQEAQSFSNRDYRTIESIHGIRTLVVWTIGLVILVIALLCVMMSNYS